MKMHSLIPALFLAFSPIASADHHGEKKEETKKPDVSITIEANDAMQFDKKEFEVTAGQTVELILKHTGKLAKLTMGHNVVILKPGTPVPTFAMAAMQASANDYVPTDEANAAAVFAKTKLIGGGETDTITFTAPAAGTYEYLCTFPGHFGIMKGKMIVK